MSQTGLRQWWQVQTREAQGGQVSSVVCVVNGVHCGIIHLHNVDAPGGQVSSSLWYERMW